MLRSDLPVLVDLYSEWCGPRRKMGEVLDRLAPRLEGKVKVVEIDVDEEPGLARAFGVRGVPGLVLFREGQVVDASVGLVRAERILEMAGRVEPALRAS